MPLVEKTGRRDPLTVSAGLFKAAVKNPTSHIIYAIDDQSVFTWWVLVRGFSKYPPGHPETFRLHGDDDEWENAEFLFKLGLDELEPHAKPPKFWPMTPNCVYKVGSRPCIGIGEYHKDDFLATLGPDGFAREIANGINMYKELGGGMHLIYGLSDVAEKKQTAMDSREFNWRQAGVKETKYTKYGDERECVTGNRNIMQMMEVQYASQVGKWLLSYARNHKDKTLAGRIIDIEIRQMFEKDPRYLNDLRWCPDPSYNYRTWDSAVDVVIMKFLVKQSDRVKNIVAGADYWSRIVEPQPVKAVTEQTIVVEQKVAVEQKEVAEQKVVEQKVDDETRSMVVAEKMEG